MINSIKGDEWYKQLDLKQIQTTYEEGIKGNICIEHSVEENQYVPLFWNSFAADRLMSIFKVLDKFKPSILQRVKNKIKVLITR